MKKILLIFTGGTIGSIKKDNIIKTNNNSNFLLKEYEKRTKQKENFEIIQPLNILSENMNFKNWEILINTLLKIDLDKYKGIIITHGSDTLSYTSALLGMLFKDIQIPMIITASNYPIENKNSNGMNNFIASVDFINKNPMKGVFVLYQNEEPKTDIYLATRICEAENYTNKFKDFSGIPFGYILNNEININPKHLETIEYTSKEIKEKELTLPKKEVKFTKEILIIKPYPNLNYNCFNLKNVTAVLHLLYHSSTASTEGINQNIINFIDKCNKNNVDFYISSYKGNKEDYISTNSILKAGAIPIINTSIESSYAKLVLLYNLNLINEKNKEKIINRNIKFEKLK